MGGQGTRFAGDIRNGAAGHPVAFIHPKVLSLRGSSHLATLCIAVLLTDVSTIPWGLWPGCAARSAISGSLLGVRVEEPKGLCSTGWPCCGASVWRGEAGGETVVRVVVVVWGGRGRREEGIWATSHSAQGEEVGERRKDGGAGLLR